MSEAIAADPCIWRFRLVLYGWRTVALSEVLALPPHLHGAVAPPPQDPPVGPAAQW